MATFKQRDNGKWQAIVRKRGYPTQSKVFRFKADARVWALGVERDMDLGLFRGNRDADTMTVHAALQRYIEKEAPKERGAAQKISRLKRLQKLPWSRYALAKLPAIELIDWRDERLKVVSPRTVTLDLMALSKVYKVARQEWNMQGLANPVKDVGKPGGIRHRDRRLLPGEYELLRDADTDACHGCWRELFIFAVETGMRRSEIATLERSQVDFGRRIARLEVTKNGDARDVPLSTVAVEALKRVPARLHGPLFGVSVNTISQTFAEVRGQCGIEGLRFHDLRREAASRLFERGLDIQEVSSITGHRTLTTLLNVYTKLRAEDLARKLG